LRRGQIFTSSCGGSYDERFYQQEALVEYLNVFTGQVYYAARDVFSAH